MRESRSLKNAWKLTLTSPERPPSNFYQKRNLIPNGVGIFKTARCGQGQNIQMGLAKLSTGNPRLTRSVEMLGHPGHGLSQKVLFFRSQLDFHVFL